MSNVDIYAVCADRNDHRVRYHQHEISDVGLLSDGSKIPLASNQSLPPAEVKCIFGPDEKGQSSIHVSATREVFDSLMSEGWEQLHD